MTEKQWIDMALFGVILYWKEFHPGLNPDVDAIVRDLRDIYHGGDAAAYAKRWMAGQ